MSAPLKSHVVLSASRMTDLPAYYPQFMIDSIEKRIHQEQSIHTVVIWTKHAASLLKEPLLGYLTSLVDKGIQLGVQLTITGMGGKVCGVTLEGTPWLPEPKVPSLQDSCGFLEQIVRLLGHPARIAIRIDPIAKFVMHDGSEYSNRSELDGIIRHTTAFGIKKFVFSLLEPLVYKKVVRRFKELGIEIQAYTLAERIQLQTELSELEQMYNCTISACCVEDLPASSCVSGQELTLLHPGGLGVSLKMPRTRARCGCTQSIDIGGWPPKPCYAGCDYCYARPVYSKKSSSPM